MTLFHLSYRTNEKPFSRFHLSRFVLLSLEKSFFERSQWIVIALSSPLSKTRRHVGLVYWQLFSNLFSNVVAHPKLRRHSLK